MPVKVASRRAIGQPARDQFHEVQGATSGRVFDRSRQLKLLAITRVSGAAWDGTVKLDATVGDLERIIKKAAENEVLMARVGKARAGRHLDCLLHDARPG